MPRLAGAALPFAMLLFFLAGCGADPGPPAPVAAVRPVKTVTVSGGSADVRRSFPARIEAARRAELGFRVSGTVKELLFKEGDNVPEGATIARLDPTDFRIVLADRQAVFDNAQRNFRRANELIGAGNISKLDFDRMEANFKSTEAALKQARQDLAYTELKAPFAGRLAKRYVERFEEVMAKMSVVSLQQSDALDVKIDVPEALVRTIRAERAEVPDAAQPQTEAWAEFEGMPEQRFALTVKEVSTRADPRTQTFEATFSMPNPKSMVVLPGMTATVTIDFSRISAVVELIWLPAAAVVADATLSPHVWLLDPVSLTVSKRPVQVGDLQGDRIAITGGLQGGEEIVAVGASYMAQGMKVSRMKQSEQAVPRADDPR
ncbi:MAG: efflux RND transporter periplasmic adaptor subunit [Pseudomonadales bacterium]|jgi:RND family efflux transporter MFP subunit|nr:efflux RND transporter periplasmic adaptor subunit [Pseudomonadales bacterium]MBP6227900.1 efflux RND transporter periplasmic adaptor subunit [Pseudomonadales bacterium]